MFIISKLIEILIKKLRKLRKKETHFDRLSDDLWYTIISNLTIQDLCNLCAASPFFYRLGKIDFKRLCYTYEVFRFPNETYAQAFSDHPARSFSHKSYASVCNRRIAFYSQRFDSIIIGSLDPEDKQLIRVPGKAEPGCTNFILCQKGNLLLYEATGKAYVYDLSAGTVLGQPHQSGPMKCLEKAPERHTYYYVYHKPALKCKVLFNALTQQTSLFSLEEDILWSSAGYTDSHQYFVLVTTEMILFYDDITKKSVTFPNKYKEHIYGKVLAQSQSFVCGNCLSFTIYDIETGEVLLECNRQPYNDEGWERHVLFSIANDMVIFERTGRRVFYYDEEQLQWNLLTPSTSSRIYQKIFHSRFFEKFMWEFVVGGCKFRYYTYMKNPDFLRAIEKKCEKNEKSVRVIR